MVPKGTINALFSLFVPLAVLLLGVQLDRAQQLRILSIMLGLGLLSGLWSLLQIIGDPQGPLYLYRITNNGQAVGLFSNRNHNAILLASLFPMLAVYPSIGLFSFEQAKVRSWLAMAGVAVLVPLVLITGSRAGLITGVLGLVAAALLYRTPKVEAPKRRVSSRFELRYAVAGFAILMLIAITVIASRAEALRRLLDTGEYSESRLQFWGPITYMAWKYFPIGSGVGSFDEVYRIDEPDKFLSPSYLNHAHNDFLEVWLTAGLPGLILVLIAVVAYSRRAALIIIDRPGQGADGLLARLGMTLLMIFAVGSVVDYPLRTPSIAATFVIAAIWFTRDWVLHPAKSDGSSKEFRLAAKTDDKRQPMANRKLIAFICFFLIACGAGATSGYARTEPAPPRSAELVNGAELPAPERADLILQNRPYLIGPFDKLVINVFGVEELSKIEVQADAGGRISFPLAGIVEAAGKTPGELEEVLEELLRASFVRDPHVTVNLKETVSQVITVDGAVKEPGLYPVIGRMTLMRAVATAKGATEDAKFDDVVILRTAGGTKLAGVYNLKAIRRGTYDDPEVYANDVVIVGDSAARRFFRGALLVISALVTPLVYVLTN